MTNFKSLTIWTIVSDFFILVGAGHGALCIGLLEIISISNLFTGRFLNSEYLSLSLFASYNKSLGAAAIFSLIGQILLVISLFKKAQNYFWLKLLGLSFLWLGFYYLTHNFIKDNLSQTGFFFGLPFLILSGFLTYKSIRLKSQTSNVQ